MGKNIGLLLLLVCLNGNAWSQILQGIGKQVEEGARKKTSDFNSTRSNKEKSMDSKRKTNSLATPPAPAPASQPAESEAPAPVETTAETHPIAENYAFTQKITYQVQDLKKKSEAMEMTFRYADGAILTSTPVTQVITDLANEVMITLDEKAKSAYVMSLEKMRQFTQPVTPEEAEIVPTGRKKKILGYNCDEYLVKYKDGSRIELWTTKELRMEDTKILTAFAGVLLKDENVTKDPRTNGVPMELTFMNNKNEKETHMLMTEYKAENYPVVMSGYAVVNM